MTLRPVTAGSLLGFDGPRRTAATLVLAAGVCVVAVIVAFERGSREGVGGDFHVFWQAGRNFATGAPLYHGDLPGARRFIYPPFAAMVFQALAIFPLRLAAEIFSVINLVLLGVATYLTKRIVARTYPHQAVEALPLVLAVVLSLVFHLENLNHVQVNEVIFVLTLLGIDAHLRALDVRAAGYFVAATALKITPVFFVIWLILRGRRRAVLAVPPLALACVVGPLLLRGPATGGAELAEYYHSFLEGFQHGQVLTDQRVQNLGALVYRMMRPAETPEHLQYDYVPASEGAAALTYKIGAAFLLLLFLGNLGLLRARGVAPSALEFSTVFLISHLLSPITWKAHLVSLLFVFYTFLLLRPAGLPAPLRVALIGLWGLIGVSGLSGRDLIGRNAYYYLGGYSVVVWTMLLLFVAAVVLTQREAAARRPA